MEQNIIYPHNKKEQKITPIETGNANLESQSPTTNTQKNDFIQIYQLINGNGGKQCTSRYLWYTKSCRLKKRQRNERHKTDGDKFRSGQR